MNEYLGTGPRTWRAELERRQARAAARIADRLGGKVVSKTLGANMGELLAERRRRVLNLLDEGSSGSPETDSTESPKGELSRFLPDGIPFREENTAAVLSMIDRHFLDMSLSHLRHGAVKLCFYNLKLLCPSLVDEYDESLRNEVLDNLSRLPRVGVILDSFFSARLDNGKSVGEIFRKASSDAHSFLKSLEECGSEFNDNVISQEGRAHIAACVTELVDNLLAALDTIQDVLDAKKRSVSMLIDQATRLANPTLRESAMTVETECARDFAILCDEPRLVDALAEILVNAAKHSRASTMSVRIDSETLDGTYVLLTMCDNGVGMPPDVLERCLLPASSTTGSGDGLPLASFVVEHEHLGKFEIRSDEGSGTEVRVYLPVRFSMGSMSKRTERA